MELPNIYWGNVVPTPVLLAAEDSGVNQTFYGFIETRNGDIKAYIKLLGGRQLVNELLANMLGRICGLPIPEGYLLRVRASDLGPKAKLTTEQGEILAYGSSDAGACSLKRYVKNSALAEASIYEAWPHIGAAMVFDDWIANSDRHNCNLLVATPQLIWLIDHGHAFTGSNWNTGNLSAPSNRYGNQLGEKVKTMPGASRDAAIAQGDSYIRVFSDVDIPGAAQRCYVDPDEGLITREDLSALISFLQARVGYLSQIGNARLDRLA